MKTTFPSPLHYSGYPLQTIETNEKEKPSLPVAKEEKKQDVTVIASNKIIDDPNNWDESWFGNYE